MIYQELIIDGMSVDIPEDTDITLEITSNIFNDITEITTNRSYTISLPKTVRNLTLLGNCDKVGINSSVPYSFHTCEYRRNGVPIIRNGRATITECKDGISVNIYWGLFPLLEKLIEGNKNINELSNDLHILFSRRNDISKYDDLQANGYGYADYYPYKFAESEDDWSSGSYVQAESKTTNYELVEGKIYTGTEVGGTSVSHVPQSAWGIRDALQPVVTCWWVLRQIMADYGMTIAWDGTAQSVIKGLAMPLVTRDADATTLTGGLAASMLRKTSLGAITIDIESLPTAFEKVAGEVTELKVITDCTLQLDIQAKCEWLVDGKPSGTTTSGFDGQIVKENYWWTYADYIKMTITHSQASGEDPDEYIIGYEDYTSAIRITERQLVDKMYTSLIVGAGKLDLVEGDTITFDLLNYGGRHNNLRMYGGTITAQLVDSDEVPYGGQFPVVKNLGDISVTDYIKTLNLLSGTFPLQRFAHNTVIMATYNELWANKSKALDWTKKLIASGLRNKPRQITYSVDGYYQHNYYKWKEDDETKGNYDHDMKISNPTLEDENDAFEFPFAASNGNRVPLYTPRTGLTGSFAGSDKNTTESETDSDGGTYSACEPRIMNLVKSADDKAALDFQINLDDIFNEKYGKLIKTVSKACAVTEYLYLSDMEIMEFDERIPVYLAQYAAYFAVLSIKVASDGYSEVEMIKLDLEG